MTNSNTEKLGKILGDLVNNQRELQQNLEGDEIESTFNLGFAENINVVDNIKVYGTELPNAFVMDHPHLGYLGISETNNLLSATRYQTGFGADAHNLNNGNTSGVTEGWYFWIGGHGDWEGNIICSFDLGSTKSIFKITTYYWTQESLNHISYMAYSTDSTDGADGTWTEIPEAQITFDTTGEQTATVEFTPVNARWIKIYTGGI